MNWFWRQITKIIKPVEPMGNPVTKEKFIEITQLVIDGLEGGYYHPDMKKRFNEKSQKALGDSGETLFGLDRKHGSQLAKYPEWAEFWAMVDADRTKNPALWKYQYRGGLLEAKLKALTASIMYGWFSSLASKYLKEAALKAIANDDRLIIHFSYSSWNGEGWFKRYAQALQSTLSTQTEKEAIFQQAIKARTESSNPVIRQQGTNMIALFKKLPITTPF